LDKSMGVLNTIIDGKKGGALLFQNARMQAQLPHHFSFMF